MQTIPLRARADVRDFELIIINDRLERLANALLDTFDGKLESPRPETKETSTTAILVLNSQPGSVRVCLNSDDEWLLKAGPRPLLLFDQQGASFVCHTWDSG